MPCSHFSTPHSLPPTTFLLILPVLSACSWTPVSVLETASGSIATVRERADELTQPVVEQVDALDRRVDSVQQGLEKLREGADLLRRGVEGE